MESKISNLKLPIKLSNSTVWTLVGPMGPKVPDDLVAHSLLCVDGGANYTSRMDIWIGDGDSKKKIVNCENIYQFPSEKSESDLALALKFFKTDEHYTLHLWGFLGGRKDHELINLGEILHFLEGRTHSEAIFYNSAGKIELKALGKGARKINHQGLFSLAALKTTTVTLVGKCEYQLHSTTDIPQLSSFGLSNVAHGEFELINNGPLLMFFPENQ